MSLDRFIGRAVGSSLLKNFLQLTHNLWMSFFLFGPSGSFATDSSGDRIAAFIDFLQLVAPADHRRWRTSQQPTKPNTTAPWQQQRCGKQNFEKLRHRKRVKLVYIDNSVRRFDIAALRRFECMSIVLSLSSRSSVWPTACVPCSGCSPIVSFRLIVF